MFTANSMNCLTEALGLALPYNGTALARTPEREALGARSWYPYSRLNSTADHPA